MKKEKEKAETTSDYNEEILHANGCVYKNFNIGGFKEPVKLFNTLKPERLEDETQLEYKIRRKILKENENKNTLFHDSSKLGTYTKLK